MNSILKTIKNIALLFIVPVLLFACGGGTQIREDVVYVEPTWGQAFHYAWKTGYALWFVIGLILLAVAGIFGYRIHALKTRVKFKGTGVAINMVLLALVVVASVLCFLIPPGQIKGAELKMSRAHYEQKVKEDPTLKPVWDSLYNNNRLRGAAK